MFLKGPGNIPKWSVSDDTKVGQNSAVYCRTVPQLVILVVHNLMPFIITYSFRLPIDGVEQKCFPKCKTKI